MQRATESEEQKMLFEWAAYNTGKYPELWRMHHIPNGGYRNGKEAANLKRQGVKAGIPDIFLPCAKKGFHGLCIELKRQKGGRLSKAQSETIEWLRCQKYAVEVCNGAKEAMEIIEWYLNKGEN